ncbi:MAG: hypothetical protein OHK0021_14950 [Bryobacter sp.]
MEPQNPEARRLLAEFALAALLGGQRRPQQYYDLVAKIAQAELAQNPNGYAGWRLQGLLARLDRKPEEAEAAFRRALAAKADDKEMTEALAVLYWDWPGREAEGDALLAGYSQRNPAQTSAHLLLAGRYAKSAHMPQAKQQLEAAGRWAEAQERLKVLREIYPRSGALALEQAILDLREKKYAEAERGLAPLYQPGQSDWRLLSSYARALVGNRKAATAVSILEKERKGAPDNQELGYVLAETYLVANDATRARALLEQMFAASQSFPPVGMRLANLQAKAGEADRARQTLSATLAASPTRLEPLVQLGQLEERAGRWEAAKGHYRKILAAQPQNIFALNGLASLIAAHGPATELNEALGYARTAQQLAPRDPIIQATLKEAEARAGKR